ncbi:hypothetical protein EW145_g5187 [Phellinidium pouzarii]|uniref:C2H2-type domain-containing protein n=1 Tax=Phellinidium pouzarii TaxID=167371 RepID=A0A4S4L0V8_9AGAM|nr:hypothetical protein EW145_g5187 [Phellinidium pouzarii]
MPFPSQEACDGHKSSNAHSQNARSVGLRCTLCSVFCSSRNIYESHIRGRKHKNARKTYGLQNEAERMPEEIAIPPNCKSCDVCRTFVPKAIWNGHIKGRRHTLLQRYFSMSEALDETENKKDGIEITEDNIDFGILDLASGTAVNSSKVLKMKNTNSLTIVLLEARLSSQRQDNVFRLRNGPIRCQLNYTSGTSVTIDFVSHAERGRFQDRLELRFEIPSQRRRFTITRPVFAIVGDKLDYQTLKASTPPRQAANILRSRFAAGTFDASTYKRHFQVMLWIEQEHARREFERYDFDNAKLEPNGKLYELQVDGLAEKRPSILIGDRICARTSGTTQWFSGFVHNVKDRSVLLHFSPKFTGLRGQRYEIHFELNPLVFRRMYQALSCEPFFNRITFPSAAQTNSFRTASNASGNNMQPFDRKI